MRFLSYTNKIAWDAKLANINTMVKEFGVVALSETHVDDRDTAEALFFQHIAGTRKFYSNGMAFVVRNALAEEWRLNEDSAIVVIPNVAFALHWASDNCTTWVLHFRLDSESEQARRDQLAELSKWAHAHIAPHDLLVVGGDRNFTVSEDERISSRLSPWRPSRCMNESWRSFLSAAGVTIFDQSEMTWARYAHQDGRPSYSLAMLDVVGTNSCDHNSWHPSALRGDCFPAPTVSDHYPLILQWSLKKRRGRGLPRDRCKVTKALPAFLFSDEGFLQHLQTALAPWFENRPAGIAALQEFGAEVVSVASKFLKQKLVIATTTQHRLATALALLSHISEWNGPTRVPKASVDISRVERLCTIFPKLHTFITLGLNEHDITTATVDSNTVNDVQSEVWDLMRDLLQERQTGNDQEQSTMHLKNVMNEHVLKKLKAMKPSNHYSLEQLWDSEAGTYHSEPEGIARVLLREGNTRQGLPRGDTSAGASLLDSWGVDLSSCRTILDDAEVERIILDAPNNKAPGPDGIPAACYKVFARQLSPIFQEAWSELLAGQSSPQLGLRKWTIAPKCEGASMLNKLRDLEVCNEARKVLARMANVLLDEVCREQIHQTQQAFFSGRDIVVNNIRMHTCFREWVRNNPNNTTGALLLLLLDCSKGYNMLAWSWIQRCLEKAALPPTLVTLIMSLIKGEVRLMLHGHEFGGAVYQAGLPQGCPLSCFIFVICIDPLLTALRRTDGVNATSGFVDDWAAACQGATWEQSLLVLEVTLCAVEEFERASGSIINKDKSAIVPSRRLSPSEQDDCRRKWHDMRISYCERLLGLYIGVDATIDDQYRGPIEKFADALAAFSSQRHHMSLAVRIMVVNVFLWSLFSFQNRHFFMPRPLLQQLQTQALRFLTPVTWCSLGFFAHLRSVYGIRVQLTDLRLSNVAQLISSYCSHTEIIECTSNALQMAADRLQTGVALRPDLVHPADSFACAREFFCVTTGSLPEAFGACLQPAQAASTTPDFFRKLYRAVLAKEQTYWEGYLEVRLGARGWDPDLCVTGLRSLPRSVPQGHRWHLLRLHLNGHYSSSRVHAAGVTQNEGDAACLNRAAQIEAKAATM